ncbi:MAG: hypothetical protein ACPGJS_14595 [Flammeovirgaceae bacterium]
MESFTFKINEQEFHFSAQDSPEFKFGGDEVLSQNGSDIVFDQPWYEQGHTTVKFLEQDEFSLLKQGLTTCIQKIISEEIGVSTDGFELENYHNYVKTDEDHFKVVSRTRDLFPDDFNFSIIEVAKKLESFLGFELTDIDPKTNTKLHIIIRINRPQSNDYNPPHKDIYEGVDSEDSYIPQFINMWIPICGVTSNSSLPLAESSHLFPESKILRTTEGGKLGKNKYRVRMIKEWNGSNELTRAKINYGEVLLFSSHLVHGLAINNEEATTRVSLEFRLFKNNG